MEIESAVPGPVQWPTTAFRPPFWRLLRLRHVSATRAALDGLFADLATALAGTAGKVMPDFACYVSADGPTRRSEIPSKPLKEMVGATGIEPVTPTMSR
jgi:hypothetical protein